MQFLFLGGMFSEVGQFLDPASVLALACGDVLAVNGQGSSTSLMHGSIAFLCYILLLFLVMVVLLSSRGFVSFTFLDRAGFFFLSSLPCFTLVHLL